MGSYRSKEDDVSRISTSIYVSNFPESFSAKDLFHSCKQYGHVVDTFIPFKRSKDGKRFGFVRFINVFNVERLPESYGWRLKAFPLNYGLKILLNGLPLSGESYWTLMIRKRKVFIQKDNGFKDGDAKVQDGGSCGDDSDEVEVPKTVFEESLEQKENQSNDPFGIYLLLNKNKDKSENMKPSDHSLKYPLGFTPNGDNNKFCMHEENVRSVNAANSLNCNMEKNQNGQERNSTNKGSKEEISGSVCSGNFIKSEVPHTGGSILCVLEELVKVGQAMGYNMDGDSVGNSGEILCIWDPNSFRKNNVTVSDYFCMVQDVWLKTDVDILMVVVYAPQELRDKRILWDYLEYVINQWDGEAKIKWAIEGDENTRYFHEVSNKKRSQLNIHGIMVEGKWIEKPNNVKLEFLHRLRNRFDKPTDNRVHIDMNFPKSITIDQQMDLECAVSKEELKRAVWECGTDKSPGPDGFSFGFYKQFWSSIENDVFAAVSHFCTFGDIPNGYIAKILANRLVGVLGDIVNEVQSAFITERQILDGPCILNEVIQWFKLKKKRSLIFKVDFEKAYDSVRWDFLDDVLKKFGFENKWCAWIQSCLKSSRGSIIINGSPTEEFQFFKGLKQGDLLSPFLFILIMESLHLSFQRVVDVGMFKGINLSPLVNLSHMFYVDDAVFVGQWCDGNINTLVHVLECFFQASDLRINMCKSKIMGVNVGEEKVKSAALKLGCLILNTSFSYLGTKVEGNMSRVQAWTLSNWKMKSLSIGVTRLHGLNGKVCWLLKRKDGGGSSYDEMGLEVLFSKRISMGESDKAIYGDDGQVGKVSKAGSRSCWRNIVNEMRILSNQETEKEVTVNSKMSDTRLENSLRCSIRGGVEHVQFNELSDMLQSVSLMPYSDRTLWIKCVPIKVNVLAWKIKIEDLSTRKKSNLVFQRLRFPSSVSNLYPSKEDQTQKISKSVFVTNFPDHFSAHDLWNVCVAYGKVVDVFIPFKRSKTGKKFAFVRFIRVDNME
nr:RNA-directed DNA polymerase, eukaryota [Tanacetum cinerariifolium]